MKGLHCLGNKEEPGLEKEEPGLASEEGEASPRFGGRKKRRSLSSH